jgi:AcrR family transcriptional regulator
MSGKGAVARREEHAEDTRRAILAAAREQFAKKGYADTSLDDIVAPARLTKGALYHHFKSKAALLEALYVEMEEELVRSVGRAVMEAEDSAWARIIVAMEAFFAASAEPEYVRIVLRDAPLVLGHRHGRELDQAIGLGFVRLLVGELIEQNELPPLPVAATSRILLAAASEVAVTVAYAEDPELARREGTAVVMAMLDGLRLRARATQPDSGGNDVRSETRKLA